MSAPAVLTLLCGVVALCTAAFNLVFYGLRRNEPAHLWLAITAGLGIAPCALFIAALYGSDSPWDAALLRQGQLVASLVVAFSVCRFTEAYLEAPLGWVRPTLIGGVAILTPLAWLPEVGFTLEPAVRHVPPFDVSYIDTTVSDLHAQAGIILVIGVVGVFLHIQRNLYKLSSGQNLMKVTGGIFAFCAGSDVAVGGGLIEGPYLIVVGCDVFAVSFTMLLGRRLAESRTLVEERTEILHEIGEDQIEGIRQREIQLAHGDRMATVGTMAAGVAHEINNPLAFVSANLNQLADLAKDPKSERARLDFDEILEETREGLARISGTVDGLLAMSKRGGGKQTAVHLSRVIEAALPMARQQAGAAVRLQSRISTVPTIQGDDRLLGQVVLNLVVNAIHSIPENRPGGGVVTLDLRPDGDHVLLQVSDDGVGIPEESQDRIFDAFFTTKGPGQGTGLGLAVTAQVVKRHRGTIEIDSSTSGTRVSVRLPANVEPSETRAGA